MNTRALGKTGLVVGEIGLGMEHLSTPEAVHSVVERALEKGVNYIDVMIWRPELQSALGEALKGVRDNVVLACHLSVGERKGQYDRTRDPQKCSDLINGLFDRLMIDTCDILFLSNFNTRQDYRNVRKPGKIYDLALSLRQQGRARFIGMSGHNVETMNKVLKDGILDVLMFPIRIHGDTPATTAMLNRCASLGVGAVVMKTFSGGQIFQKPGAAPLFPCMSYSLAQPAVATIAMGVKTVAELESNLAFLEATPEERDFTPILNTLRPVEKGICVYCNHCQPCTSEIDISLVNQLLAAAEKGVTPALREQYHRMAVKASACVECGDCMRRCPFEVDVISHMQEAERLFETSPS